jgi:hypothetical protein
MRCPGDHLDTGKVAIPNGTAASPSTRSPGSRAVTGALSFFLEKKNGDHPVDFVL